MMVPAPAEAGGWLGHKTWRTDPSEGYAVPIQRVTQFPAVSIRQPCSSLFPVVPFRYESLYPGMGGSPQLLPSDVNSLATPMIIEATLPGNLTMPELSTTRLR